MSDDIVAALRCIGIGAAIAFIAAIRIPPVNRFIIGGLARHIYKFRIGLQERSRARKILRREPEWGEKACRLLIDRKFAKGMTEEMVRMGWGEPTVITEEVSPEHGTEVKWTLGHPKRGPTYVWFSYGKLTRVKYPRR